MVHHAFENFAKRARDVSIFEASKTIPKRGARSGSPPALHRLAGGNGPPCFPTFSKARAGRQQFCVLQKNSKAVGSFGVARPFCTGPRGAMINHASRNFSKHARGVSIFEASKKFQSGGLVLSRPALCIGLREAMAASRNFAKHAPAVSIFEASQKKCKRGTRLVARTA